MLQIHMASGDRTAPTFLKNVGSVEAVCPECGHLTKKPFNSDVTQQQGRELAWWLFNNLPVGTWNALKKTVGELYP